MNASHEMITPRQNIETLRDSTLSTAAGGTGGGRRISRGDRQISGRGACRRFRESTLWTSQIDVDFDFSGQDSQPRSDTSGVIGQSSLPRLYPTVVTHAGTGWDLSQAKEDQDEM
jgi:hypothetical protein